MADKILNSLMFDESLPFFAYGIFKPGNLAFLRIEKYVKKIVPKVNIKGKMYLRDGLLLLDNAYQKEVSNGTLIYFNEDKSNIAYKKIIELEPGNIYSAEICNHEIYGKFNYLVAKKNDMGQIPGAVQYDYEGHGDFEDPYFNETFKIVKYIVNNKEYGYEKLFYLQMAYFLLWLSIERYLSFRYTLNPKRKMFEKLKLLSEEEPFINYLKNYTNQIRHKKIFSASKKNYEVFNNEKPLDTLNYFNLIRNNITHRGKFTPPKDIDILTDAINFLLDAFMVIKNASFDYSKKRGKELIANNI